MGQWGWNILVAIDQLLNALFKGDPDETVSSRAEKAKRVGKKWGCLLCKLLDLIDNNHCADSIEEDEGKDAV